MDAPDEIHEVKKELEAITKKVDAVLTILTGNEYDVTMGLLNRFGEFANRMQVLEKQTEERLYKLEKWKDRVVWIAVGAGITSGGGVWLILSKIFK